MFSCFAQSLCCYALQRIYVSMLCKVFIYHTLHKIYEIDQK